MEVHLTAIVNESCSKRIQVAATFPDKVRYLLGQQDPVKLPIRGMATKKVNALMTSLTFLVCYGKNKQTNKQTNKETQAQANNK